MQTKKPHYPLEWAETVVKTFDDYWGRAPDNVRRILGITRSQIAFNLANRGDFWERYKKMVMLTRLWLDDALRRRFTIDWQQVLDQFYAMSLLNRRVVLTDFRKADLVMEHVSIGGNGPASEPVHSPPTLRRRKEVSYGMARCRESV